MLSTRHAACCFFDLVPTPRKLEVERESPAKELTPDVLASSVLGKSRLAICGGLRVTNLSCSKPSTRTCSRWWSRSNQLGLLIVLQKLELMGASRAA